MLSFIIACMLGYLLGSFPTAYLLVLWNSHTDIRHAGSGNVGTLNSYQVTRSVPIGGAVLLVDLLKGGLAVGAGYWVSGGEIVVGMLSGFGAVIGHIFPVWLQFKGGRGLAPAAGVMLVMQWTVVAAWLFLYGIGYLFVRHVNIASVIACAGVIALTWAVRPGIVQMGESPDVSPQIMRIFVTIMMGALLVAHIAPVREYIGNRKRKELI